MQLSQYKQWPADQSQLQTMHHITFRSGQKLVMSLQTIHGQQRPPYASNLAAKGKLCVAGATAVPVTRRM